MTESEGLYPIRTVARLTGVNPVTLRAWERRYGLLKPLRTAKGHRLYSAADVERVMRVTALLAQGVAIREAARRLMEGGAEGGAGAPEPGGDDEWARARARLFAALLPPRPESLDGIYNELTALYPPETVAERLLRPLLAEARRRHGETGGEARERLLRLFLRNRLIARLSLARAERSAPRFAAVALAEEGEELELLMLCVAAAARGWRPLYLGATLATAPLLPLLRESDVRAVVVRVDPSLPPRLVRAEGALLGSAGLAPPVLLAGTAEAVPGVVAVGEGIDEALRMLGVVIGSRPLP